MDFLGFYTGHSFDAHHFLGAHPTDGGVVFRTFAPAAQGITLAGDWNGWAGDAMNRTYDGNFWEVTIPAAKEGSLYKYRITGRDGRTVEHCDPYGFGMELRPGFASIVRDLTRYQFRDGAWMKKRGDAKNAPLNIYEVHLGSWRTNPDNENGWYTYDAIAPLLIEYMKKNGFNCIELLPVSEHPSDESWGYQNTGFFAPTSRYGTAEQLMQMVDAFHAADISVLLDFVPVHFAVDDYALANYDGTPLYEYPHQDVGRSEWGSCNFMHSRGEVRSFLNSAAVYWMECYHMDGLRMDAISRILYWQGDEKRGVNGNAVDFVKTLNTGLKQRFPNCLLAAEDSTNFTGVTKPVHEGGLGFDYKWDMGWMNDTLTFMKTDPLFRGGNYHKLTFSMMYYYDANFLLPLSHDETVHGKATILQKMWGQYEQKFPQGRLLYLYMMTHPGKKLNFMGNEIGQLREWDEKREQDWDMLRYPLHDAFASYLRTLNQLYQQSPALWAADFNREGFAWLDCQNPTQCIYAYRRTDGKQKLDVVLNFSGIEQAYTLVLPAGTRCRVALHSDWEAFGGTVKQSSAVLTAGETGLALTLPAFSGLLLEEM